MPVIAPPSAYSATALARGEPGALGDVLVHCALRAALIGVGLELAGCRDVVRSAIAASVTIEVFLVLYAHQRGAL